MSDHFEREYAPSPTDWVREAVETFEASGGEANLNEPGGAPIVVVTTVGAKTGKIRKSPLMRIEQGGKYLAVASNGGRRANPGWVANIRAHPTVELQDGAVKKTYVARELDGQERREWWEYAVAIWPTYVQWQNKTDRHIPLFLLEAEASS
ncbi:nitroreductase family deazaflavin-dependent oxidoreductase [Amycolatopsis deserti]|uniref:nitroreductase family deazaflavin-dependent oxidoreductase n=1 Tax=Amycolatopsis deserti TaxID=185696 RepID=UPI001748D36A|nr:nitroreductase family deazaflavin-dependent oxidoreductase [Amycolatopsis deserti]